MAELDPLLRIAQKTHFIDYFSGGEPQTSIDVILEIPSEHKDGFLAAVEHHAAVFVNQAHFDAGGPGDSRVDPYFVTARMPLRVLQDLAKDEVFRKVELAEPVRHQRSLWPKQPQVRSAPAASAGVRPSSRTLAALIDHGCPFAHREFRRGPGTRVVTLWDMDPEPELAFPDTGAPDGFFRGREVPGAVLDACIGRHTVQGEVDEDACYAEAGYEALEVELTHGSHLLGLLAGESYSRNENKPDAAASADIAFIQLPRRVEEAPDAGAVHACILDALRYLRRFATGKYNRCVVVCAKGSQLGPHDGTSLFERALDQFLEEPGVEFQIVFAAGNGYADKVHAKLSPQPRKKIELGWMLPEDNEAPAFAELWIDEPEAQVKVSVDLQGQQHELSSGPPVAPTEWFTAMRMGPRVTLRAAPTRVSDDSSVVAPAGRVPLIIDNQGSEEASIHAYLCWGGRNLGCARETKQAEWKIVSCADSASLTGAGTLIGDACGRRPEVRVIGGYVGANDPKHFAHAEYSAAGPTRGDHRLGPDCVALSDTDAATRGIPGPGTRSGIVKRVWGTSVAAPQAARALIDNSGLPSGNTSAPTEIGGGFLV